MTTFPITFLASTMRLTREIAVRDSGYGSVEHAFAATAHFPYDTFNHLAWAAYYHQHDEYTWHGVPYNEAGVTRLLPSLSLAEWQPACAEGPRDRPVTVARHMHAKLTLWTENADNARLQAVTERNFSAAADLAKLDSAFGDPNLVWLLGLCVVNPSVLQPFCDRVLEHVAPVHLVHTLVGMSHHAASMPASHLLCRIAVHVCAVAAEPAHTYGATRARGGNELTAFPPYSALPTSTLAHFGANSLMELCLPLDRAANSTAQGRTRYEDEALEQT